MAETLGSLCDKLTVVKLKQWHNEDDARKLSLDGQEKQLKNEIDEFIASAISGNIPVEKLSFASNKVYKKEGNVVEDVMGSVGEVFSELANTNCELWHEQEFVYEFEKVPADKKDHVVKRLALLNLKRTKCIDGIDNAFKSYIESIKK